MHETSSLKEKIILFINLLAPILITQVSMYSMNFFDTIMSGRAGAVHLAGVAIGSSLWMPIFTSINGVILAITPIIAQLLGAKATNNVTKKVQQGIYLSIFLASIILLIGFLVLNPILIRMDLEPEVRHIAKFYLISLSTGIFPLFIFNTLRCFIDALGKTRTSMIIILISLPLNVLFNYIFIFGKLGVPAYGGIGSGIATSITYWLICFITIGIIFKVRPFYDFHLFAKWVRPSLKAFWEQLKIGIPIGFAVFFETSIFSFVTLLMSVYSTYTIAAHQAALNFASLLYMIPLSVGMGLTIAVGYEVGAKRYKDAQVYTYLGMLSSVLIAIFSGLILFLFGSFIAELYNTNPTVIKLTVQFIFFAIFFQLADAFGAPIQGALRGYKDVNITLIMAFTSFWIIGLPTGWSLANFTDFGPFGYWIGFIVGLSCGAIGLLMRLIYIQRRHRTEIEGSEQLLR